MILVINVCRERLHYYEFVKPVEDVLSGNNIDFETWHYKQLDERILNRADKIIICGTSLKDNEFLGYYHKFDWLLDCEKPVFGICAGMQIIGMVFGNKINNFKSLFGKKKEIGFYKEKFEKGFLGAKGGQELEVYHLHDNYVKFNSKDFIIFNKGRVPQAIKSKDKEIYGVLFHPEVRQKGMIYHFAYLI